jgi:nucleotide-binding universal stress UspA family protein
MKILIAVDGSPYSRAAARYVARHMGSLGKAPELHLLHVQPRIPYPRAASLAGRKAVDDYQRSESRKALLVAERELARARVAWRSSYRVGDVATEVDKQVRAKKIDLVVSGSRGYGAFGNLALGSVATKLIATLTVPVLIVTRQASAHRRGRTSL